MERALTGLSKLTKSSKSTKDLGKLNDREWPTDASQYQLLEDCGRGVSATVHRAICLPFHEVVAIKKMNLESMNCDLEEIIHEAQTMRHYNHPNVLPLYASFVEGQDLWMVMPFIAGGSVLHVMKYAYPEGLDEVVIATIGREVLKALDYVHKNGGIHRDVKAGNILVDRDGTVKLADFGVAASLERNGSWGKNKVARMTFVGTPCWMAPEVMEQTQGYDSSADIWSFGITLLEMAHGHAPFAKFPPMKILLMTLQNPPPTLDDKGKKHFSKAIRDVVARCLQKDCRLRPTAAQLLEHKFFKVAKDEKFLREFMLNGLPPLGERVQEIRQGKAATSAQENDKAFNRSQDEYKKGISTWNFDLEALKAQAALEPDDDGAPSLPTICEDEPEQTVGRAGASAFTPPSAAAPAAAPSMVSVFATREGQSSTQQATTGIMPPPPLNTSETSAEAPGVRPQLSESSQGAQMPLSPGGGTSPPGLSRESSCRDSLNTTSATPTVAKQRKAGRFNVYEDPTAAPPLSPANDGVMPSGPSVSSTGGLPSTLPAGGSLPDLTSTPSLPVMASRPPVLSNLSLMTTQSEAPPLTRVSDDGSKREDGVAAGPEAEQPVPAAQKKGRFTVIENESRPLSKSTSITNIVDAKSTKSEPGALVGSSNLGKPPPAPTSSNLAVPPVTVVLPKLQELLDHAAQQQQALQRLIEAVRDSDRGKQSPLLSRSQSSKALFDPPLDDQVLQQLDALRARVSELEAENNRLRAQNHQMAVQLGTAPASASEGGALPSRPGSTSLTLDVSAQMLEQNRPAVPLSPRPTEAGM